MEDSHSTSIAAFMVEDKFLVICADSRRCSFSNYGSVYGKDEFIKIHHIYGSVYGAGSGSFNMVDKVFREARKACSDNLPNEVEQVANIVSAIAQSNLSETRRSNFVVGGRITGPLNMYSVKYYAKGPEAELETKHKDEDLKDEQEIETTAEKKRKDRDAKEEYEYRVTAENEVFLGSGKKEILDYLSDDKIYKKYPVTASTSLEEAKDLIRQIMRDPMNHDFCTDGMLRAVSVLGDGTVGYSTAEIVDPGVAGEEKYYGEWIENSFDPVGQNN